MKFILFVFGITLMTAARVALAQGGSEAAAGGLPSEPVEKSVALPNNITLQYVEQGDAGTPAAGVPVIFLHGFTDSWRSYERVLPHLPASVHAFALSLRGHGRSSRPLSGYRPEDFAEDIALFMKEMRIREAVIVGHSMGSTVAQCLAVRHPELVQSLVLVGGFADFDKEAMVEFGRVVAALHDPIDPAFVKAFQQSTLFRPIPSAFFETVVRESMKVPARVWQGVLADLMKSNYIESLKAVRKPALLLWGDQDGLASRRDQDRLLASLQGSRLLIYEGTGHATHWEEPERFAKDLLAFIKP